MTLFSNFKLPEALTHHLFELQSALFDLYDDSHHKVFYNSIDIRNGGFKISYVDSNMFPSGFNNLTPQTLQTFSQQAKEYILSLNPHAKRLAIIPEQYTRNKAYAISLQYLQKALTDAQFTTRILNLEETPEWESSRIILKDRQLMTEEQDFVPDIIVVNNDLIQGIPQILKDATQQCIPNLQYSWSLRKKTHHFFYQQQIIEAICARVGVDPWLLTAFYLTFTNMNLSKRENLDELADMVNELLKRIQQKYTEYKISSPPYVYIKANRSTHGRGIFCVSSPKDLETINKQTRKTMKNTKYNQPITEVIVQEGIPTTTEIHQQVAEITAYSVNNRLLGYFHRLHENKSHYENLNSNGATFSNERRYSSKFEDIITLLSQISCIAAHLELTAHVS